MARRTGGPWVSVRRGAGRPAAIVAVAALPWTWFLLRDVPGPLTDLVAILLPLSAGGVVVAGVLVAVGRPRARVPALAGALSALLVGAVAVVGPWLPADAGQVLAADGLVVAGANVDGQGGPLEVLRPIDADLWVVPELSEKVRQEFAATYPHHLVGTAGAPRIGVFSRYPLRLLEGAGANLPGERIEVAGPAGRFVLYALHIPRPWVLGDTADGYQVSVAEHQRLAEAVAARVSTETLPVVVVGDLNSTDRGRDYRALTRGAGLVDAMRDIVGMPTSVGKWRFLLARIDHVLLSPGWCGDDAQRVPMPGSSHRAVTATVGPCAVGP